MLRTRVQAKGLVHTGPRDAMIARDSTDMGWSPHWGKTGFRLEHTCQQILGRLQGGAALFVSWGQVASEASCSSSRKAQTSLQRHQRLSEICLRQWEPGTGQAQVAC